MTLLQQLSRELSEGYGITEKKAIIVKATDVDENQYPVVVKYEITDNFVNVTEVLKLERNYFDLDGDIIEAIRNEEGNNLTIDL